MSLNKRLLVNELDSNINWAYIGLDLAKHDTSLVGITEDGEIHRIDRIDYETLLDKCSQMAPVVFAMEPCNGMNWLVNQIKTYGHECRVISGVAVQNYVATYFSGQKNDLNDAEALAFLARENRLQSIREKSPQEMELQSLMTIRELYVKQFCALLVSMKGIAQNWGVRLGKHLSDEQRMVEIIENSNQIPPEIVASLKEMIALYKAVQKKANSLTKQITSRAKSDDFCKKIMDIPGIGPMIASRLKVTVGDIKRFSSPRKLAAYYGVVPKNFTTGHVQKMGRITKRGDRLLRTYLVQGSAVLLMLEKRGKLQKCALQKWISKKRGQLTYGKMIIALAAKLLRIVWAVLYKDEKFSLKKAGVARCSLPNVQNS